jgi:hypothetical protein
MKYKKQLPTPDENVRRVLNDNVLNGNPDQNQDQNYPGENPAGIPAVQPGIGMITPGQGSTGIVSQNSMSNSLDIHNRIKERMMRRPAQPSTELKQGVPLKQYVEENSHRPSVSNMLHELLEEKKYGEMKKETSEKQKSWKWPWKWKSNAKVATKNKDLVLVFYFTIKGELENFTVPIYGGNMVIIKNKVYEFDPRAVWTTKIGYRYYKLLAIKEIDRRPISNLDLDEIRDRGDSTDSDEFLIKAALKAQVQAATKAMNKGLIIILVIIVIGALAFFFFSKK